MEFPGLKAVINGCLCARRWLEAHESKSLQGIILEATNEGKTLKSVL